MKWKMGGKRMKNIFIEGLQGTGKSTLTNRLSKELPQYHVYREGDTSPVELAWCSYMTKEQYEETLAKYPQFVSDIESRTIFEENMRITAYTQILTDLPEFYQYMEGYEIYNGRVDYESFRKIIIKRYSNLNTTGNISECSLFQNAIESMMLFYQLSDEEILQFYREVYKVLNQKQFILFYLSSNHITEDILQIKKERTDENGNEIWFSLMMKYLESSPYGMEHQYSCLEDLIKHLMRRKQLECRIISEVFGQNAIILEAKQYEIEECLKHIAEF